MTRQNLRLLRFLSLLFLLPGLGGLVYSAMVSTGYLETLPREPVPADLRMIPRNIHGVVVYQTEREDRKLALMEDASVCVFVIGLGLGLVYMRKLGIAQLLGADEDEALQEHAG